MPRRIGQRLMSAKPVLQDTTQHSQRFHRRLGSAQMRRNIMFTKGAPNLNVNSERTIMHLEHHHDSQDQARPNNQSSATGTGQEWLSKTNLFSDGGTTNE